MNKISLQKFHTSPTTLAMVAVLIVGACYEDIRVTVDSYPEEDSKGTAKSMTKTRGGNGANSAVVLAQLLSRRPTLGTVHFMSTLPVEDSSNQFIFHDLRKYNVQIDASTNWISDDPSAKVPQAIIVLSESTHSRTILSHNPLPPTPVSCFQSFVSSDDAKKELQWIHFEGRSIAETTEMMETCYHNDDNLTVSVELEKPYREGIDALASFSDVCFFSKVMMKARCQEWGICEISEETRDLKLFVSEFFTSFHKRIISRGLSSSMERRRYVVTWGELGAFAADLDKDGVISGTIHHAPIVQYPGRSIVDTNGAGDTFIGAFIYFSQEKQYSLGYILEKATRVATFKCTITGFDLLNLVGFPFLSSTIIYISYIYTLMRFPY